VDGSASSHPPYNCRLETVMAKKAKATKRRAFKCELINTGTDKRYVRRNRKGQFKESDDVDRSLPTVAGRRKPR
jgi:hypothetical protein